MAIYRLSDACSVASQIRPADVAAIVAGGFTTIVCNRPDDEEFSQPTAASIRAECAGKGVAFFHIPIDRSGVTPAMAEEFAGIVADSEGPVLAYCRSGQRSSVLWQASGSP